MSVQMTIDLPEQSIANSILHAVEAYKYRLRASIRHTKRQLQRFEQQYNVTTAYFLDQMAAEDLEGGDMEWIEWAGEADMLEGLEKELQMLEATHYQLP